MDSHLSMESFERVVLPPSSINGRICMLIAYFDDSGTHDSSDVVLWQGAIGNQYQWALLDELWAQKLRDPSPNKNPIRRFHMTDCHNSTGEFLGWSRTATDYLAQELGDIIKRAGIQSICSAVSRKDWDELIFGDWRRCFGDAEQQCIWGCFADVTNWAKTRNADSMAFIFDDRPHRNAQVKHVYDIFRRGVHEDLSLDSISFVSSSKFYPLQAADLLAWEHYQYVNDALKQGLKHPPKRRHMARILAQNRYFIRFANRAEIKRRLASEYGTAEKVAEMAQKMSLDYSGEI